MRLFTKIYIVLLVFITLFLIVVESVVLIISFKNAYGRAEKTALSNHMIARQVIQFELMVVQGKNGNEEELLKNGIYAGMGDLLFSVCKGNEKLLLNTDMIDFSVKEEDGVVTERLIKNDVRGLKYIQTTSILVVNDTHYRVDTLEDVTAVFSDSKMLRKRCRQYFVIAVITGVILAFLLAYLITNPINRIKKASRRLADGDYSIRINNARRDELGELSLAFDNMAETIEDKIAQLEKNVVEKNDFIANFSHEIKTPMTNIIGYSDMIAGGGLGDDEIKRNAEIIMNEGMRLESLALKLMDLSSIERNRFVFEDISVVELFDDIKETYHGRFQKKDVCFEISCSDEHVRVEYDLVKTMLINLIDNSIKANSKKISLKGCRCDDETGRDGYSKYKISVNDDGCGIPEKDMPRIKEAFYMADKARSREMNGAGLGLSICERIALLHGESLRIESRPEEGTKVEFICEMISDM